MKRDTQLSHLTQRGIDLITDNNLYFLSDVLSSLLMLLNFVELGTTFLAGQEITFLFPKFCVHSKELLHCLTEFIP